MQLFRLTQDIPFMNYGRITTAASLIIFLFSISALVYYKLNLSVEFTGGTLMEVEFSNPVQINQISNNINDLNLGSVQIQSAGDTKNVLIKFQNGNHTTEQTLSNQVYAHLQQLDAKVLIKKTEFVGPQVGKELVSNGILALIMVSLGLIIYLAIRFEWRFALSAVIANIHDVVVILGCFAFFGWEFSLTVLAGILAVLGYSVNESVVIFDRIRENFKNPKLYRHTTPQIINNAITATMSRTIITHGSTEAMVLSMFFFGGEVLHGFSMALTIGIVFGIYSSIFVGSPLLLMLGISKESLVHKHFQKDKIVV